MSLSPASWGSPWSVWHWKFNSEKDNTIWDFVQPLPAYLSEEKWAGKKKSFRRPSVVLWTPSDSLPFSWEIPAERGVNLLRHWMMRCSPRETLHDPSVGCPTPLQVLRWLFSVRRSCSVWIHELDHLQSVHPRKRQTMTPPTHTPLPFM